jgi:hypothetical protein
MTDEARKLEVIDNPAIAECYANKLVAASFDGGAVVVTLGTTRFVPGVGADSPKGGKKHPPVHVTARVALSPSGAVELANALGKLLKVLVQIKEKNEAAAAKTN